MTATKAPEDGAAPELSAFHRLFDKLFPAIRFYHERVRGNDWFTEITPELWVGGAPHSPADYDHIVNSGITAVLNVRAERQDDTDFYARNDISYEQLRVPDVTVPDAAMIECGVNWMRDQIGGGRVVLVHCAKGRGRSATLVAGYLMREKAMSFDAAKKLLDAKRRLTKLEPRHRRVLEAWLSDSGARHVVVAGPTR